MRKALLAATAIATMFTATSAMNVGLDIKGGLNIANARGEAYEGVEDYQKSKLGAVAGLGAQLGLTDMFAIQPEVMFTMKGTKIEGEEVYNTSTSLSYLNVPVLFKLNIPVGKVTPNVYAGPDFGFNLAASADLTMSDFDGNDVELTDIDIKEETSGFDFGLAMGGGVDFNISESGRILLDLRYTLGFSNTFDTDEDGFDSKNGAFGVMLGYGFNF